MRILAACCAALALVTLAPTSWGTPRPAPTVAAAPPETSSTAATSAYAPPLPRPLALHRGFDPPAVRWGSGHRGVDLAASTGSSVLAPGAGTVSFAGTVAGRGVVTVAHPDGLRSSVEPVAAEVAVGDVVHAGDPLGRLDSAQSHCAPSSCLHWGVRDAHGYVDPLLLLRGGPTVLLPLP
ncbi:MAG: M23 family metallopeptidase [Actinomycetales bacterium]|nr:M23 family metallopeptidase [Actinomycetales bacterium]